MEIGGTHMGASTYAMKKAMEMPNLMLTLVQQSDDSGKLSLGTKNPAASQILELAAMTGKGKIIDLVA